MLVQLVEAVVGFLAAGADLVDVVLRDGGADHAAPSEEETGRDALEWGELDAHAAEARVDEFVHDRDEDDEGEGVEVVDDVVGDAAETHGGCLGSEVVDHLVVGEPYPSN